MTGFVSLLMRLNNILSSGFPAHVRGLKKVFISSAVDVLSGIILNAKTDLLKRDILEDEDAVGYTAEGAIRAKRKSRDQPWILCRVFSLVVHYYKLSRICLNRHIFDNNP